MKKSIILTMALVCAQNTQTAGFPFVQEQEKKVLLQKQLESMKNNPILGASTIASIYGISHGTTLIHESGHAIVRKAFGCEPIEIISFRGKTGLSKGGICISRVHKPGIVNVLSPIAGPLAGIGFNLAVLNGMNTWQAYKETGDLKKARSIAKEKSPLDSDQNLFITGYCFAKIFKNAASLMPIRYNSGHKSDGYNLMESIVKRTPKVHLSFLCPTGLGAYYLGGHLIQKLFTLAKSKD